MDYPHLDEVTRSMMEKSDKERIHYINGSTFIPVQEALEILERFTELVDHPKIPRMPNYLLVGETNNGKTSILLEFESQYPVINQPPNGPTLKVLYMQAPAKADESRLYSAILERLNVAHNGSDIASNKLKQVKLHINSLGLKILLIDELHNISPATANRQREFLTTLKVLCNELMISVIAAGTSEVERVITYDPQLANRFEPILLTSWENKQKEFISFIKAYEMRLPLKHASNLGTTRELAGKIWKLGEGLIGEYVTVLKKASVLAIKSGEEKITLDILNKIKFVPPSTRSENGVPTNDPA
jgi:ATP-dependent Clp protease ATP-binding subunit ClpA